MEEKTSKKNSIKDDSVRNVAADLFAYVFSEEKALIDLYRGLGKEISIEDIEYLSLSELLQRTGRYNDTAFRTKDNRLIVFAEHQSTRNKNMPFRFLEYAVDGIRLLKVLDSQNKFGEKLMQFPKIEFYVAYNGKKALEEADKTLVVDLGDIRVTAQVVDIRFDELPKETAENAQDNLAGYSYFAKIFEEMKSQGKSPHDAYSIAVEKGKEKGYLAHIWSRKELVDMFQETYCYDEMLKEEAREEGMERGLGLGALIFNALKENVSIPAIAEKYGVTTQQVERLKKDFAV
ncbi:MAG: hypothetical protein FWE27_04470 [Defluviitaleaceae bacterium]|nr:hypothetical protein [Defluviitaleaceae bacterium]